MTLGKFEKINFYFTGNNTLFRMVLTTIQKLTSIREDIFQYNKYIDNYDAMSLASVNISLGKKDRENEENKTFDISFTPTTELAGLSQLVAKITAILNEAYIGQQNVLIKLKVAVDEYNNFNNNHHNNNTDRNSNRNEDIQSYSDINIDKDSIELSNDFKEIIELFDSSNSSYNLNDNELKNLIKKSGIIITMDIIKKQLKIYIQNTHNKLLDLLDIKVNVYDLISTILEIYIKSITKIASDNEILNAFIRAKKIVQPQLDILLAHRYLNSQEVSDTM